MKDVMKYKVLVTDGTYGNVLDIVRSLGKKKIDVSVIADSPKAISFYSKYCKRKITFPEEIIVRKTEYINFLINILREDCFDLLIPVANISTLLISENKNEIEKYTKVILENDEKIKSAMDKKFVYDLARKLNIPVPKTVFPLDIDNIKLYARKIGYPLVIKSRFEACYGHRVKYAYNEYDLLKKYKKIYKKEKYFPMLQEYINGKGYGFFAIYDSGVCKGIFMHKRIRELPPSGGVSTCAEAFYDEKLYDYGRKLLDSLRWHGVAMVEFKKDVKDGKYKVLEINPRFWGSLGLAISAGVDFPYYLCQIARGEKIEYYNEYNRHLRFRWIFRDVHHILQNPSSTLQFIGDFFKKNTKSDITIDDIFPTIMETKKFIKYVLRKLAKFIKM